MSLVHKTLNPPVASSLRYIQRNHNDVWTSANPVANNFNDVNSNFFNPSTAEQCTQLLTLGYRRLVGVGLRDRQQDLFNVLQNEDSDDDGS